MTVTMFPEQSAETTDRSTGRECLEPEDKKADVHKLATLLAQAYAAIPLFP